MTAMPEHQRMRSWHGSQGRNPHAQANEALAQATAQRREAQRQIAQQYAERREEAAGWARNRRDALAAAELAKMAESVPKTGEPVLIRQNEKPDNPS